MSRRRLRLAFARFAEPEQLLQTVAAGARPARWPWPERDLAFIAISLLTGLRLSELIGLNLGAIDGRPGERR